MDISKQLNEDEDFGMQLKGANFTDDTAKELTKGIGDEMKKLELIYNHIQRTVKWDGVQSIYTGKNLKKAYNDKSGNAGDINLLLTAMLRSAGIIADPVILSTRSNGLISPVYASISDCNYVIVRAVANGKSILLDATEPDLQVGYLPFRCLNGEGHIITNDGTEPVSLLNPKSLENISVQLELNNGKLIGTIQKYLFGLSAFNLKESVKSAGGKQEHFNKLKNSSADIDYLEYQYNNLDSLTKPIQLNYKIALKESQDSSAEIIYIDPIITDRLKENPFTSPERKYPVDFGIGVMKLYNFQIKIPQGYSVDELPENKSFALPDNGGTFVYQVTRAGENIMLSLRFSIDKPIFLPSEYSLLRTFYDMVINKESQQIILKKTSL